MSHKIYVGIDNGVTGTIGVISPDNASMNYEIPVVVQQNYTKAKQLVTRINAPALRKIFLKYELEPGNCLIIIERPMVNPTRFKATMSAIRALEAVLTIIETMSLPYMYMDSKEWQRFLLPQKIKKEDTKKASLDIGLRLFPQHRALIEKHKDADGLLIAEYARRKNI